MSNRERWIVYPLLFYAVLSCMKSALVEPTDASYETVTCNQLLLESVEGQPLVQLGANIDDEGAEWGLVELFNAHGQLAAQLGADPGGGFVTSVGAHGALTLTMGHDEDRRQSGLQAKNKEGQPVSDPRQPDEAWGLQLAWPAADAAAQPADPSSAEDATG